MGKTSKPLYIVCTDDDVFNWPEVQKLKDQQHSVIRARDFAWDSLTPDIVMGPTAHRMSEHERRWLPNAIVEARRRKYPPKPGDDTPDPEAES